MILITGASGFIGKNLQKYLAESHVKFVSLRGAANELSPRPGGGKCDITNIDLVRSVLNVVRPNVVIHLAAAGVTDGSIQLADLIQTNVGGLNTLFAASAELEQHPRFVVLGSGFEYARSTEPIRESDALGPWTTYGVSKAASSLTCGLYKERYSIILVRPFNVYGPQESLGRLLPSVVLAARRREVVKLTGCEQIRDYIYVGDLVRDIYKLAEKEWGVGLVTVNVGSGSPGPLKNLLCRLSDELRSYNLEAKLDFSALPYRPGEPMKHVPSIEYLQHILGPRDRTSVEDGLRWLIGDVLERTEQEII